MNIKIFFGQAKDAIFNIKEIREAKLTGYTEIKNRIESPAAHTGLQNIFLRQTHSSHGLVVDKNAKCFEDDGDYLITKEKRAVISVLTADCMPIIMHDTKNSVIAIIHAGWKGSLNKITKKTVIHMLKEFNTDPAYVNVFFGPCAKVCCYEVGSDFGKEYNDPNLDKSLIKKNNLIFFDNVKYNILELQDIGIEKNISLDSNTCTICNLEYGSYRRLKEDSPLNISSVYLE